jgi:hypothetical protein
MFGLLQLSLEQQCTLRTPEDGPLVARVLMFPHLEELRGRYTHLHIIPYIHLVQPVSHCHFQCTFGIDPSPQAHLA